MTALEGFLRKAKRRIDRFQAVVWAWRGAAVAAGVALVSAMLARRWPPGSLWPPAAVAVGLGAVVGVGGWARARPPLAEVARLADLRLGGRERLGTALELTGEDGSLAVRQRSDAEAWAAGTDPADVVTGGRPRRAMVFATSALMLAVGLGMLHNPAAARRDADRAESLLREQAAREVEAMARRAEQAAGPSDDPALRRALADQLRRGEQAVRRAPSAYRAVAALSRTQQALRPLAAPNPAAARATAAAGAALASHPASARAGAALSGGDQAGDGLAAQLTAALATLGAEQRTAVADQLRQAATGAPDDASPEQLRRAADELSAGNLAQAGAALAAARQSPGQAATELAKLAASLPALSPHDQAGLGEALQRAGMAAADEPALAEAFQRAGDRLAAGDAAQAGAALGAASRSVQASEARQRMAADAAGASRRLQAVKESLLVGPTPRSGNGTPRACPSGHGHPGHGEEPLPIGGGLKVTPGGDRRHAAAQPSCPGQGQGDAQAGPGEGQGEGEGQGSGQGSGQGQGEGSRGGAGPGHGQGGGSGLGAGSGTEGHRGGGATGGGAGGSLGPGPGLPSEQVVVPGVFGDGRAQDVRGGGIGTGAPATPVPYERVYAEYRAAALAQVDRALVPDQVRELLLRYFVDIGR